MVEKSPLGNIINEPLATTPELIEEEHIEAIRKVEQENIVKTQANKLNKNINEFKEINEGVTFQKNTDVVEKQLNYINALEQERLNKIEQRNLMLELRRQKSSSTAATSPSSGKTYTRTQDEVAQSNIKKTPENPEMPEEREVRQGREPRYTERNAINPEVTEEFSLETAPNKDKYSRNREDKDQSQNRPKQKNNEEEESKAMDKAYLLENDELINIKLNKADLNVVDEYLDKKPPESDEKIKDKKGDYLEKEIEARILMVSDKLDKKQGNTSALDTEIEKRIKRIAKFIDKKPGENPQSKIAKLRQKFNKL